MSRNTFSELSNSLLNSNQQSSSDSKSKLGQRIIYPAIVRDNKDKSGQNRIKAEIVSIDDTGQVVPGKDKNIQTDKLPICIPFIPQLFHVVPQVGECVLLLLIIF